MTTREQILDLAESLYRSKGYAGFSYHDISTALGVKNAAVHYHFPAKSDLGVEIIRRARERMAEWIHSEEVQSGTPTKQLEQTIEHGFVHHLEMGRHVCLIGNSAVSFDLISEEMRTEVRELAVLIIEWLTDILRRGKQSEEFGFNGNPGDKAELIASALSGSLQISRMGGKIHFDRVVAQIKKDLTITS